MTTHAYDARPAMEGKTSSFPQTENGCRMFEDHRYASIGPSLIFSLLDCSELRVFQVHPYFGVSSTRATSSFPPRKREESASLSTGSGRILAFTLGLRSQEVLAFSVDGEYYKHGTPYAPPDNCDLPER